MKSAVLARVDRACKDSRHQWFPEEVAYFEPAVEEFLFGVVGQVGFNRAYWTQLEEIPTIILPVQPPG